MKSKLEFVHKTRIYLFVLKYLLVATSSKSFPSDIAVKSRYAIKLYQERHNANSVISHNVVASIFLNLIVKHTKESNTASYPVQRRNIQSNRNIE